MIIIVFFLFYVFSLRSQVQVQLGAKLIGETLDSRLFGIGQIHVDYVEKKQICKVIILA